MVITGECYDTKIVAGEKLVEAYLTACWGEEKNAPEEVIRQTAEDLADLDNWSSDPDAGPIYYKEAFEIGAIEFIRLFGYAIEDVAPIAIERERQVDEERWTPQHDDKHQKGELAKAGSCYARLAGDQLNDMPVAEGVTPPTPILWPWADRWWKPKDIIRNLERAGALIAAEIGRLKRSKK